VNRVVDEPLESELICLAVGGDRVALAQLLLRHYDPLQAYVESRISRRLQGLVRAEDILQQTFLRAAQRVSSFEVRGTGAFRGWLFTIAANLVRDAEKRRRRERRAADAPLRAEDDSNARHAAEVDQLAGVRTSPSRRAQRGESAERVHAAMAQLPAEQREMVRRRYLLGQSLEQIAAATGQTKDAVRGLCFRARRNLRTLMGRSSLYFSGR
jgi:RNA polymerase sigma-70 factor, ECF subfamily